MSDKLLWAGLGAAWGIALGAAAKEAAERNREHTEDILSGQDIEEMEAGFIAGLREGRKNPSIYAARSAGHPPDVHPLEKYAYLLDPSYVESHPRSKISRFVRKLHKGKKSRQETTLGSMRG